MVRLSGSDSHGGSASGSGAEMSGNLAEYAEKLAKRRGLSHFGAALRKMRLTPWGCQLNVAYNSEKFTSRETNAPPRVVRELHVGFLNGFA